jgi:hypothetical protein
MVRKKKCPSTNKIVKSTINDIADPPKPNPVGPPVRYPFEVIYKDTKEFLKMLLDDFPVKKNVNGQEKMIGWSILSFVGLIAKKPYSKSTYYELLNKYTSQEWLDKNPEFIEKASELSDTKKKINDLLEQRLVELGMKNKLNPTLTIFCLKNNHGYVDKQETLNKNIAFPVNLSAKELKEFAQILKEDL